MSKLVVGILAGVVVGVIDGAAAWFTPAVRPLMAGILIGSCTKGIVLGILCGFFARKVQSDLAGLGFGGGLGLLFAALIAAIPAANGEHYYLPIMLPGFVVGSIIGLVTQHFGQQPNPQSRQLSNTGAFAFIGGCVGGFVGYLVGKAPELSLEDVLTRGANLHGFNALMRAAAESAFNWMLAGIVVGVVGGLVVAYLAPNRSVHPSLERFSLCPHCGGPVPSGMQFCGKCGRGVALATCKKCGKAVPPDQQFCGGCGTQVQ